MNGSLGKQPGKGHIVRLVDSDHDGTADSHTTYVAIDNPHRIDLSWKESLRPTHGHP